MLLWSLGVGVGRGGVCACVCLLRRECSEAILGRISINVVLEGLDLVTQMALLLFIVYCTLLIAPVTQNMQ